MKMINKLDLFVLMIFDQGYTWMGYMCIFKWYLVCVFKWYLEDYFQKSSLVEVLNKQIEVSCLKTQKNFSNGEENTKIRLQVLMSSVDQTLGSSQSLPDSNDNVNGAVSFGEDNFRNEKLKLKLQVVPNPPPCCCAQTNVKAVDQQTKPKKMEECRNDSFFNLKFKVKVEKPKRRELYLRCTEDCFEMYQKTPGKLRDMVSYDTVGRYTWHRGLPVPKINITLAYILAVEPLLSIIDQIANGSPPAPHVSMRYELLRFYTVRSYPKENKSYLIKLAEAGFYYASDDSDVVCYCCGVRRYNWVAENRPMEIHERINPDCKFLRKNDEVNVPVQYFGPYKKDLMAIMDIAEPRERSEQSEDVNNYWAPERICNPTPAQQNRQVKTGGNSSGINSAVPKHTQYATKTARERGYSGWPDTASHTPQELAEAGFFYAGFVDCVRCFYCGIGLRHWTKDDTPWIEHASWSRNCVFVKQKKGEEFVNLVQLAVHYSQDNEAQSNSSVGNQLPVQEVERILLSDAAQSVLEMGYQPRIIEKAIEQILRQDGKITAQFLMEKVLEVEEAKNPPQAAPAFAQAPAAAATAPQHAKLGSLTANTTEDAVRKSREKPDEGDRSLLQSKENDKDKGNLQDLNGQSRKRDAEGTNM